MRTAEQQSYAVIGLSQFSRGLASALVESGATVLRVVHDPDAARDERHHNLPVEVLDTTDEAAVGASRLSEFQTVIVACEDDFERNLLTTVALRRVGVAHVVALAHTDREREVLLRMGADRVVQPEQDAGRSLARELQTPCLQEESGLGAGYRLATYTPPPSSLGQSLRQSRLREVVTVLALQRGSQLLAFPSPDTVLQEGDLLAVVGTDDGIARLARL
jgi:trk system potassium uptake protein TrkA